MDRFIQRRPSDAKLSGQDVNGNNIYRNEKYSYIQYKSEYGTMYYRYKRDFL